MIVIWLIIALALAIAFARVYKSNTLFWVAFTSLSIGIAAESLINRVEENEEPHNQVQPIQVVTDTSTFDGLLADVPQSVQCLEPNPVGQVNVPEYGGDSILDDPYVKDTLKPPQIKTKSK